MSVPAPPFKRLTLALALSGLFLAYFPWAAQAEQAKTAQADTEATTQVPAASATKVQEPAASTTPTTSEPADRKDIVLGRTATTEAAVVAPAASSPAFNIMLNQPPKAQAPTALRVVFSSALADLGLHMVRSQSAAEGHAQANVVVSPHGVASVVGMLHVGAAGPTAQELAAVLETGATGGRLLREGLMDLTASIQPNAYAQWLALNRLWVDATQANALSPIYVSMLKETVAADGVMVDFAKNPEVARTSINQWAKQGTQGLIPEVVPTGVIKSTTRMVLTNANYFKGEWLNPFQPSDTKERDFYGDKQTRPVPTMHQTLSVREGIVGTTYVMELPFTGAQFSLMLALPPAGHTVQALEADLMGADMASWQKSLQPQRVRLALPKFEIAPSVVSLNEVLKSAGAQQAFKDGADFSGMFKDSSKALKLDDVLHSAGIKVNEEGTVAASATAAVMGLKSFSPNAKDIPLRQFNRPFLFMLVHKETGAPLFMGRVAMP